MKASFLLKPPLTSQPCKHLVKFIYSCLSFNHKTLFIDYFLPFCCEEVALFFPLEINKAFKLFCFSQLEEISEVCEIKYLEIFLIYNF
jgi:hypothetical protein